MTEELLLKLRELIRAEVAAGIASTVEDESGYRGDNHAECRIADRVFQELLAMNKGGRK